MIQSFLLSSWWKGSGCREADKIKIYGVPTVLDTNRCWGTLIVAHSSWLQFLAFRSSVFPFFIYNQGKDLQAKIMLSATIRYCSLIPLVQFFGEYHISLSPELFFFSVNNSLVIFLKVYFAYSLIISCLLMEPLERCFKQRNIYSSSWFFVVSENFWLCVCLCIHSIYS